jgi:hypothetical protein
MKSLSNLALKFGLAYEAVKNAFATKSASYMPVGGNSTSGIDLESEDFFEVIGSSVFFESYNTSSKTTKVYKECPPLNYILNQKNLQLTNGRFVCNRVFENDKRTPVRDKSLRRILDYPNPLETGKQFIARLNTILKLFRYCPVLKVKAAGFESEGVQQLWILPPHKCKIKLYKNKPFPASVQDAIERFELIGDDGKTAVLNVDDIYFFTSQDVSIESCILPESILEPLRYPINNIIKNYEARGVITERRGALGILSPDGADSAGPTNATPGQKKDLQNDYRKYGLNKDQWQIIISTISMKFTPMSMNIKDLMLLEMNEDDIMTLCAALGFKFQLLPWGSKTAFANQNIGEKSQYNNFTIPEADNLMFQFTDCTEVDLLNIEYRLDYSHVESLQADEKQKSEVRRNNVQSISLQFSKGFITYGRAMELLGESDSINSEYKDLFIYDAALPQEIKDLFKQAIKSTSTQNQPQDNGPAN